MKVLNLNPDGEDIEQHDRTPEMMERSNPLRPPSAMEGEEALHYLRHCAVPSTQPYFFYRRGRWC